jgi:hypothetical protein
MSTDRSATPRSGWRPRGYMLWLLVAVGLTVGVASALAIVQMQAAPRTGQSPRQRRTATTRTATEGRGVDRLPLAVELVRGNRVEVCTLTVDNWYEALDRLAGLEELAIRDVAIPDRAIEHLLAIRGLKRLEINGEKMTDRDIRTISKLTTLEELQIVATNVTDLAELRSLTRLKRLHLGSNDLLWRKGLTSIEGLRSLQSLCIVGATKAHGGIPDQARIGDGSLPGIGQLTELRELTIENARIDDRAMREIAAMKSLRQLALPRTGITDKGLVMLGGLQNLAVLDLDWTAITDAGIPSMLRLSQLRELNLGETRVTAAGISQLKSLKELDTLRLGIRITDSTAEILKGWPRLKRLRFTSIAAPKQPERVLEQLRQALPNVSVEIEPWREP